MSILAHGMTDPQVPDFRDHAAVIARLSPTLPELFTVRDYWRSTDPDYKDKHPAWTFVDQRAGADEFFAYFGPGGFGIRFGPHIALVGAACRYSGFVTIPALQAVHLPAFRSIARALGGNRLVMLPEENGPIWDAALYDGVSLDDCLNLIQKSWGDPHSRTEIITEDLEAYYRRKTPAWYVESLE